MVCVTDQWIIICSILMLARDNLHDNKQDIRVYCTMRQDLKVNLEGYSLGKEKRV